MVALKKDISVPSPRTYRYVLIWKKGLHRYNYHPRLQRALNSMTSIFTRVTQGEKEETMRSHRANVGAMIPQAKECQEPPGAKRGKEGFQISGLENSQRINF
jgi:hypothetical protein